MILCDDTAFIDILLGTVDTDHAKNLEDRISITGFILFLNGGLIQWSYMHQPVVALSSTKAEFYAASFAWCEANFFFVFCTLWVLHSPLLRSFLMITKLVFLCQSVLVNSVV
jgi:hypothetical protein